MKAAKGNAIVEKEYAVSNAEHSKFSRPDAVLELRVYFDAEVRENLTARAKGIKVNDLVNKLLKDDIAIIEPAR